MREGKDLSDSSRKQYSQVLLQVAVIPKVAARVIKYRNNGIASRANIHDQIDVHAIFGRHSTDTDAKMSFVIEEEQLSYQGEQRSALCINVQHLYHDLLCTAQNN